MLRAAGNETLQKHFDNAVAAAGGQLRSAKVATRKGADGKPLSMGFGFVECSSESVAAAVIKKLQVSSTSLCALQVSCLCVGTGPGTEQDRRACAASLQGLWGRGFAVLAVPVCAVCSHTEAHLIRTAATLIWSVLL